MRKYEIVVLGAGGVGKSALTVRFIKGEIPEHYNPTIEELYQQEIEVGGERISLDILDTAGAEQFTMLNEVYIRSGHGFLLVFSLTDEASFCNLDHIRQQIFRIKGDKSDIPIMIVGTKQDLYSERQVTRQTIQEYSARWGFGLYETSAKKNWHVQDVFEELTRDMRKRYPAPPKKWHKKDCLVQ
ncbi:P-loop containing nucleoside triphosphate hydrolase protein [Irpex rosettiformis]|uniref:P-loop containing nucleoside triphosphate hydrolase protein n=1 Tax=Irpex rosettiformis TaxID=378272 RepID=A0ACB8UIF8_9APHY|nr:P-loop containing nucleoside triphosphate hydrolase protein [Irpex rosettiformis]